MGRAHLNTPYTVEKKKCLGCVDRRSGQLPHTKVPPVRTAGRSRTPCAGCAGNLPLKDCAPASAGAAAIGLQIKFDPFSVCAPRFAQRCPVPERRLSGSGKRNLEHPLCAPMSAILSARRAGQDKIRIPPVIQQAVLRLHSSSHRIRFPKLAQVQVWNSAFSFDHEWPFSFRQDEKKMGIRSRAAQRHIPASIWCICR